MVLFHIDMSWIGKISARKQNSRQTMSMAHILATTKIIVRVASTEIPLKTLGMGIFQDKKKVTNGYAPQKKTGEVFSVG